MNEMRQIVETYAQKGLPQDLFDAAKRSEIASAEFQRNSIPGLASVWSEALTAEGRNSDDDIQAIRKVTSRRQPGSQAIPGEQQLHHRDAEAVPLGRAVAAKGFGGEEKMTSAPTKRWCCLPGPKRRSQLKVPRTTSSLRIQRCLTVCA